MCSGPLLRRARVRIFADGGSGEVERRAMRGIWRGRRRGGGGERGMRADGKGAFGAGCLEG